MTETLEVEQYQSKFWINQIINKILLLILINLKKIKQIVQPSTDNSIYCCLDIEVRILIEIFAILSIISKIPLLIPVRILRWLSIFNGKIHNLSAKGSYVYQWIFVSHFIVLNVKYILL